MCCKAPLNHYTLEVHWNALWKHPSLPIPPVHLQDGFSDSISHLGISPRTPPPNNKWADMNGSVTGRKSTKLH